MSRKACSLSKGTVAWVYSWESSPEYSEPKTRGGEEREGGHSHLQQQLQTATESMQLSAGVCYGPLPIPISLKDGRDSVCKEEW